MGSNNAGQIVQVIEDNGLVAIYLGNTKARELRDHPGGSRRGRRLVGRRDGAPRRRWAARQ
jgi:hypothetical protein